MAVGLPFLKQLEHLDAQGVAAVMGPSVSTHARTAHAHRHAWRESPEPTAGRLTGSHPPEQQLGSTRSLPHKARTPGCRRACVQIKWQSAPAAALPPVIFCEVFKGQAPCSVELQGPAPSAAARQHRPYV